MRTTLRSVLIGCLLLASLPVGAEDQLPRLPASSPTTLSTSGQSLSVTCYMGNPNDNNTLGLGIVVNTPQEAGFNCNSLNYACQGRCYGCYSDFDLSEDVCVDASGRKFLR